jgi:hypothetical protein
MYAFGRPFKAFIVVTYPFPCKGSLGFTDLIACKLERGRSGSHRVNPLRAKKSVIGLSLQSAHGISDSIEGEFCFGFYASQDSFSSHQVVKTYRSGIGCKAESTVNQSIGKYEFFRMSALI